jgi:hypothetical protein
MAVVSTDDEPTVRPAWSVRGGDDSWDDGDDRAADGEQEIWKLYEEAVGCPSVIVDVLCTVEVGIAICGSKFSPVNLIPPSHPPRSACLLSSQLLFYLY